MYYLTAIHNSEPYYYKDTRISRLVKLTKEFSIDDWSIHSIPQVNEDSYQVISTPILEEFTESED